MNELTQRGIAALKAGDRITARQLLSSALRQNPADLQAWLWMSGAVERDEERLDCLLQIQRLEPGNAVAARGIAQIIGKNPYLRGKVARPARQVEVRPQPQQAPATSTAEIQPGHAASATIDVDNNLLDRAISAAQPVAAEQPAAHVQTAVTPDRPEERKPAEAGIAAVAGRAIPIISPRQPPTYYNPAERIFHSRPSLVGVILYFWLIVFLLYGTLVFTSQSGEVEIILPVVLALGAACLLFTVYVLVRLFQLRYELTTQTLSLPVDDQRLVLPLWSILGIETEQNPVQKFLGTGNIMLDAPLEGQLARVRIRNIPDVKQRAEQIRRETQAQA